MGQFFYLENDELLLRGEKVSEQKSRGKKINYLLNINLKFQKFFEDMKAYLYFDEMK